MLQALSMLKRVCCCFVLARFCYVVSDNNQLDDIETF